MVDELEHIPAPAQNQPDADLETVNRLNGRSLEQPAIIDCMRHLLESPMGSSEAAKQTTIELLPPEILLSLSALKAPLLSNTLRTVLRKVGIQVEQKRGLFIPQADAEALYNGDTVLMRTARDQLSNWRLSRGISIENSGLAAPTTCEPN